MIYMLKDVNQIWFNEKDWSYLIKEKLDKSIYDPNVYNTLAQFNIVITNAGVSIQNDQIIYQLKIDNKSEPRKLMPIMKINFDLK